MKKTAVVLMILTTISKIIGFVRDLTLSYFYGTSNISDAYLISLIIPTIIFEQIGVGIYTSYIPTYNSAVKERDDQSGLQFTNHIINLHIIICTLIVLFVVVFTTPIIRIFAWGFDGQTLRLAVSFTRISIFGIYFTGLVYIFTGYLHLKNDFIAPVLMGIPLNLIIIVSIVLSHRFSIIFLSIGSLIALVFQMLFLLPFAYRKKFKYSSILDYHNKYLKKMLHLSVPIIIGLSVNQINVLINQTIASQISVGGIAALIYANRLNLIVQEIFVIPVTTVMYPLICQRANDDNIAGLKKAMAESINSIHLLVIPATVGFMIFAEPIVKLLFGRGAFNAEAIAMTSNALFFFSIGMIGLGLREILSRTFFSMHDTKTPIMNAALAMIINVILSYMLSKEWGIGGLALANSISAIFCTIFLFISLRSKIGSFGIKRMLFLFIKVLIASVIMGILAKLSYTALIEQCSINMALVLSISIAILIYFFAVYFMKIDEAQAIIDGLKKKIKEVSCMKNNTGEVS